MGAPLMSIICRPVVIGAANTGAQPANRIGSRRPRGIASSSLRSLVGVRLGRAARRSQNRHDPGLRDPHQPTMEYRMAKLTLYHAAPSRSSITRWMLEEIGEPSDIHLLSLSKGDNRAPNYLAVNPMGKVPALKHGDVVITEGAAICAYLADEFPRAKLNVPIGSPRRGVYLKWLFFGPNCIEAAMMDRANPRKDEPRRGMLGYGDFDTVMDVTAKAVAKGPYLMGEQFTAADVVVGSTLRWGMMFKLVPERPEFTAYTNRLAARPPFQRAEAKDKELAAA